MKLNRDMIKPMAEEIFAVIDKLDATNKILITKQTGINSSRYWFTILHYLLHQKANSLTREEIWAIDTKYREYPRANK